MMTAVGQPRTRGSCSDEVQNAGGARGNRQVKILAPLNATHHGQIMNMDLHNLLIVGCPGINSLFPSRGKLVSLLHPNEKPLPTIMRFVLFLLA